MTAHARAQKLTSAYWILMGLSVVTLCLPHGWADGLKHLMQLLTPSQDVVYRSARTASLRLRDWSAAGAAAESGDDPARSEAALQNQVVALSGLMDQVRRENSLLRGLREKFIPPGVVLVPARVVARDIGGWRDSLLLSRGASQQVRRQDAVASRLFVSGGETIGVAVGHLVLAREFLLGRIEQAGPFTSRLQLFSDVGIRTEVRVGRVAGGRFSAVDYPCTLLGLGNGEMRIEDVPLRFIVDESQGARSDGAGMRVGDLVATPPNGFAGLPTPMVIGRVRGFEHDPRRRLVATVQVESMATPDDLDDVFIVATGSRDS